MNLKKLFFQAIGWFSVGLAILGIILPIMPTVPFLLVAVWAFSKSSPELAMRIRNHKTFGPPIRDWQDGGIIPLKGKAAAIIMMACSGSYLWFWSHAPTWFSGSIVAGMILVAGFVLTRPSQR
jgi:uncharacterized membrane protein YbaN (DUF454 family)